MQQQHQNILEILHETYGVPRENLDRSLERQADSSVWVVEGPYDPVHFDTQTRELLTPSGERLDQWDCDDGEGPLFLTPLPVAAIALRLRGKDSFFYQETSKLPNSAVARREIIVVGEDSDHVVPSLYNNGATHVWTADESDLPTALTDGHRAGLGLPCLKPLDDFRLLGAGFFGERQGELCRLKVTEKNDGTKEEQAIPIANGVPLPAEFIGDEDSAVFEVAFESPLGTRTRPVALTPDLQSNPRQFREKFSGKRMGARILQLDRERRLPEVIVEACVQQWPGVEPAEQNKSLGFDEDLGGYVFEEGFVAADGGFSPSTDGGIYVDGRRFSLTNAGPNLTLPHLAISDGPDLDDYLNVLTRTYGPEKSQLLFAWALSIVANTLPWWRERPTMLLNAVGPLGEGKTVLARLLTALFRCKPDVTKIDQLTVRSTQELLDFYAHVPVIFDDFRGNRANHQEILNVLRSAYGHGKAIKGTPKKGVTIDFIARGAPLITGEFLPHDETGALRSRSLIVAIQKSDRQEDTLEEIRRLYETASALLPELLATIGTNSARLRQVLAAKTEFFKARVADAEMNGVDRLADLYAGAAAVRDVVLGPSEEIDEFFATHLESALTGVEEQSLVHDFLVGLNSYLTNNKRAEESDILTSVNDDTELAIAKSAAVDAFKRHRCLVGDRTSIRSEDITRHLKQYEGAWVADRSRTAKFPPNRRHLAFIFDLEHPDLPAPVLSLASRVVDKAKLNALLRLHEPTEEPS